MLFETALGSPPCGHRAHTYTHTHCFPRDQEPPGRPLLSFPVFPFGRPNPSTRRRITRTARVRKPSAENRSHIQTFFFPRSSACVVYPRHTAHILAFAFPSCYHDCPVPHFTLVRVCVFSISLFRFHGAQNFGTLRLNFPD